MQIAPHDSSGPDSTSCLIPKITTKFELDYPLRGRQVQVGCVKIGYFGRKTHYNLIAYKTDAHIKIE